MSTEPSPRIFVTYSHDSPQHKKLVLRFAEFLRTMGLDARLDQWDDGKRQDWSLWAIEQTNHADFVIVIASPAYKRRADGDAPSHEGRGAQFEAAMLRNELTRDLRAATERILPVVLPGGSLDDIPTFLHAYSTTHYRIEQFTEEGVADLVAAITGRPANPMPPLGKWQHGAIMTRGRVLVARTSWLASAQGVRAHEARIDGVRYVDSVVLRSAEAHGYVELDLGAVHRRLTAVAGVLDDADEPFQVGHFRVVADDRPVAEHRVSLGKPATIDVDVTGVLTLRLEMSRPRTGVTSLAWGDPTLS